MANPLFPEGSEERSKLVASRNAFVNVVQKWTNESDSLSGEFESLKERTRLMLSAEEQLASHVGPGSGDSMARQREGIQELSARIRTFSSIVTGILNKSNDLLRDLNRLIEESDFGLVVVDIKKVSKDLDELDALRKSAESYVSVHWRSKVIPTAHLEASIQLAKEAVGLVEREWKKRVS